MSKRLVSCPRCGSKRLTASTYQVRCGSCRWAVQDPDPLYVAHVEEIGRENITYVEPIVELIDALPSDFGARLTTTKSALPAAHPANDPWPTSLTAAEFRNRREAFGLSAEWLAERFGVALKTVQRWENGHRPVPRGVEDEMDIISTAIYEGAARGCAEHLLETGNDVMMIPRTGSHLGFPASWYRALVEAVRECLRGEFGDRGLKAAGFRVVYFDEVEGADESAQSVEALRSDR